MMFVSIIKIVDQLLSLALNLRTRLVMPFRLLRLLGRAPRLEGSISKKLLASRRLILIVDPHSVFSWNLSGAPVEESPVAWLFCGRRALGTTFCYWIWKGIDPEKPALVYRRKTDGSLELLPAFEAVALRLARYFTHNSTPDLFSIRDCFVFAQYLSNGRPRYLKWKTGDDFPAKWTVDTSSDNHLYLGIDEKDAAVHAFTRLTPGYYVHKLGSFGPVAVTDLNRTKELYDLAWVVNVHFGGGKKQKRKYTC